MKWLIFNLFLSWIIVFSSNHLESFEAEKRQTDFTQEQEYIVRWARKNLPQTGTLREGRHGYVYLKVDDDYINQLFPMLPYRGYTKPPYFRRPDSPGAHISVMYVNERNRSGEIKEIGQKFSFRITGFASVPPRTHKYIVLEVDAPDLEQFRQRYNLSPLLHGHKFHITIAKKKRRLNFS